MPVWRYPIYRWACSVSNLSDTRSQSYRAPYFWSQKWASTKKPSCHTHIPNFIRDFHSCGASNPVWKFGQNWPSQSLVRARRIWGPKISTGPKKKELGPKKKIQWEEGNRSWLKFAQKNFHPRPSAGLVKHRFYIIPLFSLNVLVDLGHLWSYVKVNVKKVWENERLKRHILKISKYIEISYTFYTTRLNGKSI